MFDSRSKGDITLKEMHAYSFSAQVPSVLAYGRKGLPRRRIPPDADLVYIVKLLSANGDAQMR